MFTIKQIEETLIFDDAEDDDYNVEYDDSAPSEQATFTEALDALNGDYWDNIDERSTEVICYPADQHQNIRTGAYTCTHLVISGKAQDLKRLMACYSRLNNLKT